MSIFWLPTTGHLAGILVGLLYVKGPLKWIMDIFLQAGKVTSLMMHSFYFHLFVLFSRKTDSCTGGFPYGLTDSMSSNLCACNRTVVTEEIYNTYFFINEINK